MSRERYNDIDSPSQSTSNFAIFSGLVVATQVIGLIMVILVGIWMGNYRGGFAWQSNPQLEFNYHPLFMTLGMIFLYGDAILLYRVFRHSTKLYVKIAHALVHVMAFLFTAIALKAVFDSHDLATPPIPNLYSLHSWFGIVVVILFGLQWVLGFVSFLFPKLNENIRRAYLPAHRFWGILIFILACATAFMGITEKAIFSVKGYSKLSSEAILLNLSGCFIALFGILVTYLMTIKRSSFNMKFKIF